MFHSKKDELIKIDAGKGEYRRNCMLDFRDEESRPELVGSKYKKGGIVLSPSIKVSRKKNVGNKSNLIKELCISNNYQDCYTMRKRALAPCLSNRFKQYLTHITESPNIK
jgi:hypothetical protein